MKRVLVVILALSVLLSSTAFAQGNKDDESIQFNASIGIGTAFPYSPDEFSDDWDPSFGFMIDVGATRLHESLKILEVAVNLDYSFFLADMPEPLDANVFTAFINVKIKPLDTTARPYIFAGAGFFRYWIVDADFYDNALGFGGGAGVEIEIDEGRRVFIEGKNLHGRTRETARAANTSIIPIRAGITFAF
jgi:opacity protein-like surface antigen